MTKKNVKNSKNKQTTLSKEDKKFILEYSKNSKRNVEQIAIVIDKPVELIKEFINSINPPKSEPDTKSTKSLLQTMLTQREGMAIMTQSASEVCDDVKKTNKTYSSRFTKNAIHKPRG